MSSGLAGKKTSAIARMPPPDSTFTVKLSLSKGLPANTGVVPATAIENDQRRWTTVHDIGRPGSLAHDGIEQTLMNSPDTLELTLGGESFIKSIGAKLFGE